MYINVKCESIYKRNFEGASEFVRKIWIREHVQKQNRSVVRGSKRNYVRFLLTKKP